MSVEHSIVTIVIVVVSIITVVVTIPISIPVAIMISVPIAMMVTTPVAISIISGVIIVRMPTPPWIVIPRIVETYGIVCRIVIIIVERPPSETKIDTDSPIERIVSVPVQVGIIRIVVTTADISTMKSAQTRRVLIVVIIVGVV
jgi:hypothetical protein